MQILKKPKSIFLWVLTAFFLSIAGQTYAQAPAGTVLITGTDFTPVALDAIKTIYSEPEVLYYGVQPTRLSGLLPFGVVDFSKSFQYGITDNPFNLNPAYFLKQDESFSLTYSAAAGYDNSTSPALFSYEVKNLEPSSPVTVKISYCCPINAAKTNMAPMWISPTAETTFKLSYLSAAGTKVDKADQPKINPAGCKLITISGLSDATGTFTITAAPTGANGFLSQISFDKIEVYGKLKPTAVCDQGNVICVGEKISLRPKAQIAGDYKWEVSTDGSTWASIATSSVALYEPKTVQTYQFRCTLTIDGISFVSDVIKTEAKMCCSNNASRQTIFYDDFGTFDLDADPSGMSYKLWDYSDVKNPMQTPLISTTYPYRHELEYALPFHTYKAVGPPVDGEYTVSAYITNKTANGGYGFLEWAAIIGGVDPAPFNYDISGEKSGAALFINLNPASNGLPVYTREISNLCSGKTIYFQAWINYFSGSTTQTPTIKVKLTDKNKTSNFAQFSAKATNGPWVLLSSEITLTGSTLILEIINESGTLTTGNDLVLDDIKLMTCGAPRVDAYFNLATLAKTVTVCDTALSLNASYSSTFASFFGNTPYYLYQWTKTPKVISSWKNLAAPSTADSYKFAKVLEHPDIKALNLKDGDKIYFRIVAAAKSLMDARSNFQGAGNEANGSDPCENYSVSRQITATVKCPTCVKADIVGLKLAAAADSMLCPTGRKSTTVSVETATPLQPAIGYQFYKSATAAFKATDAIGSVGDATTGFSTQTVNYADAGWYTLSVWDKAMPTESSCQENYQIQVQAAAAPTYTMAGNQTICDGATLTDISAAITAVGDVSFTLNTSSVIGASAAVTTSKVVSQPGHTYSYTPVEASAPGTYSYTISDLADKYCSATSYLDLPIVVKVNPSPVVVFTDPADICTDATGKDLTTQVTVDGTIASAATGLAFSGAAGVNITAAGVFTPKAVTVATSQVLTAKYTDANGCKGEDNATIKIQPKPDLTFALQPQYCSEETIDLNAAVTPAGGIFTALPAATISATNTVSAANSNMASGVSHTFTYNYTDPATLCSNTIAASTYSITVPAVGLVEPFSKSGVKDPTVTGDLVANFSTAPVPAGKTLVMNWINPDGTLRTEKSTKITVTHDATVTNTFTYQAYQTIDGCEGPKKDVTFSVTTCAAEPPAATEDYFCSQAAPKSITVSGQRAGDIVGWLPSSAGADGFKGKGLPHSDITQGATYTLASTAAGVTEFYVAAYDPVNFCWSASSKVTFKLVAEPVASIASQDKIACYNYNTPKPITLTPLNSAAGITATFKLDGVTATVPEYVPAAYSAAGSLTLTYQVDSLITPPTYSGTAKSCTSNLATQVYSVETVKTPTIASEKVPVETVSHELTMTGDKAANELRWYLSPTGASVKTGAKYDPIQGVDYSLSAADVPLTVYGKEVSPNGCESAIATGTLTLVKCPHTAPGVVYEKDKLAWDDCEATVKLATPAVKLDNATLAKRTATTKYKWFDGSGTLISEESTGEFVPQNIAVGKHKLFVSIYDIVTATGTYCETPPTEVNYEVFRMPVPDLVIPKASLCVYDSKIDIKGFDDLQEVASGTFYMTPGSTSTAVPMAFNPSVQGKGDYSISFEYTTADGCTAKSAAKTVKVTEVAKPDNIESSILEQGLSHVAGKQIYLFSTTPDAGLSLQWYNTVPTQGASTPVSATASYSYMLAPQFEVKPGVFDSKPYYVYFNHKDPISGCESQYATAKLTVTNCPTPAPIVVHAKACTYFTGTEIPSLTAAPSSIWPAGSAVDAGAYVYTTDKLVPNATYPFSALESTAKEYKVEFRTFSPLHGCESPATTATLTTFKQSAPRAISSQTLSECFGLGTNMSFEVENPTGTTVNWYDGVSNTSTNIGSKKKFDFVSSDGDRVAYASLKMIAEPYCESTPGDMKFTFDERDAVPTPSVTPSTQCATPNPGFPGAKVYTISALASNVVWYADAAATQKIGESPVWDVLENNPYKPLELGVPAHFYAKSFVTNTNGTKCWSAISEPATVLAKPSPKKLNSGTSETTLCQGSGEKFPVYYPVKNYPASDIVWFTKEDYELGNPGFVSDSLDPSTFPDTESLSFVAYETLDGCESDTSSYIFTRAPRPVVAFDGDKSTLYYCADPKGYKPLSVSILNKEEGDVFKKPVWVYTDEDGDKKELIDGDNDYVKTWFYSTPGIDEVKVIVENEITHCKDDAVIRLVVADRITPSFGYNVFSGPQEITFDNQATKASIESTVWNIDNIESETYSTRYNWTFVYNADQSVRKMVQKDTTEADKDNSLYYVGRGPSDYDSVIVVATEYTDPVTGEVTRTYKAKLDGNGKGVRVSEFNGKRVQIHGGIPFKYGYSTVSLTRSVYTMDGIPYDTRSCNVTSPEVEVFMPITTGLYIPTSFAPGHSSPLVSVFKPYGSKITEFNIWVYDNWGNTVFYSNKLDENGQPTESWDGRDKEGNLMPADVYYWKVDATFEDGTKWEGNPTENGKKKAMGSVFLLR